MIDHVDWNAELVRDGLALVDRTELGAGTVAMRYVPTRER